MKLEKLTNGDILGNIQLIFKNILFSCTRILKSDEKSPSYADLDSLYPRGIWPFFGPNTGHYGQKFRNMDIIFVFLIKVDGQTNF